MRSPKLITLTLSLFFLSSFNAFADLANQKENNLKEKTESKKHKEALFVKLQTPNFINLNFASITKYNAKDSSKNSYSTTILPSSLSYGYKFKLSDVDKIVFGSEAFLNYFGSDVKANSNNVAADIDLNYSYGIKAFIGIELFKDINFFYKTGYSRANLDLNETSLSLTVNKTKNTYNLVNSLSLEITNPKENKDIYYIIEYSVSDFGRINGNLVNTNGEVNKYKITSNGLKFGIGIKF